MCVALGCPHPYLAIESLTGPKEVWYFNGYRSSADRQQVVDDYAHNAALIAGLGRSGARKAALTLDQINVFSTYREDLSRGDPWAPGQGRFLVITMTKRVPATEGTVFETADGTRFIVLPSPTREDADDRAQLAGAETNVFAVRPYWSMPDHAWVVRDPAFWLPSAQTGGV